MFVGLSGSLDYDPIGSYSNQTYNPSCCNMAFYYNPEVESLIREYDAEPDADTRVDLAHQIQAIVYEDIPYIPILNTAGLWAYDTTLQFNDRDFGFNDLLMLATLNYAMSWANISSSDASITDMVYAHTYDLTEYMPFVIQSYAAQAYVNPIMPGLFERDVNDPNFVYKPAVAESYTVSDDLKTYNVTIRDDATFSDGNPVTAEDVVNTYHLHMAPAVGSAQYGNIVPYISKNDSISVIDDHTVQFVFDEPYFLALSVMSQGIMEKSVLGTVADPTIADYDYNSDPETYGIGAGPYMYDVVEKAQSNIKLAAVDNWWGGDVGFDSLSFNKYAAASIVAEAKAGNAQIIDNNANFEEAEFEGVTGWATEVVPDFGTQMLTINMKHPIFGTGVDTPLGKEDPTKAADAARYLRQAIAHLIPVQTIIDEIWDGRGEPGTSLWPNIATGYDDSLPLYDYDVQKAIDLIEQAGYTITYPSDAGFLPAFEIVPVTLAAFFSAFVMINIRRRRY
jgi:ABC-type transport system substrate-binding protein